MERGYDLNLSYEFDWLMEMLASMEFNKSHSVGTASIALSDQHG